MPDYIFNGKPIQESFVIEAAEVAGLSIEDYVNQKDGLEIVAPKVEPPTKGKPNSTVPGAAVEETQAPKNGESKLEPTFSGLAGEINVDGIETIPVPKPTTDLTTEQKRLLPSNIKNKLHAEGYTVENYTKALEEDTANAKKDIIFQIGNYTDEDVNTQAFSNIFNLKEINAPVYSQSAIGSAGIGAPGIQAPVTAEIKEQRVLDLYGPEYLKVYKQYNKEGVLKSDDENISSEIQNAKSTATTQIKQKNLQNTIGKYEPYQQEYLKKYFSSTALYANDQEAKIDLEQRSNTLSQNETDLSNLNDTIAKGKKALENKVAPLVKELEDLKIRLDRRVAPLFADEAWAEKFQSENEQLISRANFLTEQINNIQSSEEATTLVNNITSYNSLVESQEFLSKELLKKYDKYQNDSLIQGNLALDYSFSSRAGLEMEKAFGPMFAIGGAKTLQALNYIGDPLKKMLLTPETNEKINAKVDALQETSINYYNEILKKEGQTLPSVTKLEDFNKTSFSNYFSDLLATSLPTLTTLFVPIKGAGLIGQGLNIAQKAKAAKIGNNIAMGLFGAQSFAQEVGTLEIAKKDATEQITKLNEQLKTETNPQKINELKESLEYQNDLLNKSEFEIGMAGVFSGAIDMFTERLGSIRTINNLSSYATAIGKSSATKLLQPIKGFTKGIATENLEEIGAAILKNGVVKNVILGDNVNIFEGVDADLVVSTTFASVLMQGGGTIANLNNVIKEVILTKDEKLSFKNLSLKLANLYSEESNLSGKERRKKAKEIMGELGVREQVSLSKLSKMSRSQILELGALQAEMRANAREAIALARSTEGLPTTGDIATLKELSNKYAELSKRKEQILKTQKTTLASIEATVKQKYGDSVSINPEAVFFSEIADASFVLAKALAETKKLNYRPVNTIEEFNALAEELNLSEATINEFFDGKEKDLKNGQNAFVVDNNTIIVNESTIKERAAQIALESDGRFSAVAALHEIGHIFNASSNIDFASAETQNAIDEALAILESKKESGEISEKNYTNIKNRLEVYKDTKSKSLKYEEFMQVLNDATLLGILNESDYSVASNIKNFFNKLNAKVFGDSGNILQKLKNGRDVYNYISSFKAKLKDKKLGVVVPEEEDKVAFSKIPSKEDLKKTFDKFVQNPDGTRKYNTLAEFQASEDYMQAYEAITAGKVMEKSILGYVLRDKSLQSLDPKIQSEVINKVQEEVSFRFVKNFDPAKNESLFGYLYGTSPIVDFAVREVKKAYVKTEKGVSIDKPTVTGGQFEIEAEDVDIEAAVDRNITYEQQVKDSVLKSGLRLDGKPFITEENKLADSIRLAAYETFEGALPEINDKKFKKFITDSYKKKLMPTIKKALGNKKQLTNFLLENRDVLLSYDGLPISYWVQIERLLPDNQKIFTKFIKRLTTQADIDKYTALGRVYTENDADGPGLYQLLNPTDAELVSFFTGEFEGESIENILGYAIAGSTMAARKSELGANIGLQMAFDATPGVAKQQSFTEQEIAKIALKVNRDPNIKFSKIKVSNDTLGNILTSIEDGLTSEDIAKEVNLPKQYIDIIFDVIEAQYPPNLYKEYGQEQISYINSIGFNEISEEAGIPLVGGGLKVYLNRKGKLTKNGEKYVGHILDFANKSLSKLNDSEKIDWFINFIRFEGKALRASGEIFRKNDQVWENVYSKIIKNNPDLKDIFNIRESNYIYFADQFKVGTFIDPSTKENRLNAVSLKDSYDIQSEEALNYFLQKLDYFKELGDLTMGKAFIVSELSETRTALRLLGVVEYIEKGKFENLVYEHISPASYLGRLAMSYLVSDKLITKDQLINELKKSKIALISKSNDNKVNKNHKQVLPQSYKLDSDPIIRYTESGIDINSLEKITAEPKEKIELKEKITEAKTKETQAFSKAVKKDFNKLLERATGIEFNAEVSAKKAAVLGKNKGQFKFFIPPSADDFAGLMYVLYGKGKQGNADMKFIKENLLDPFAKGIKSFESAKQSALNQYREFKKLIRRTPTKLAKVNDSGFTNEQAVRVFLWAKSGYEIPGMTKKDINELIRIVRNSEDLLNFAANIKNITVFDGYPKPENNWEAGTLTTDLLSYVNSSVREQFLETWNEKVDDFFDENNLNKLEQTYGKNYREALEDVLYRMKTGRRKEFGKNKLTSQLLNWANDSVGAVMFFNTRSALLQQLSLINFVNFSDNNPLAAGKAFANQPQFWKDYATLFNSDFLKQRRAGLKTDVNADEIAKAAEEGTNKVRSVIALILKKGFLPTQMADSHAIAIGGASFYRNRINRYVKEGMEVKAAEEQAFLDFQEIAEETQQSSRPDRISMQQASPIGRIILAFANTPMQYARLTKKAALDLANGRGDWKTNLSKIMYYGFVQNVIFSSLQSALFALAFDDDGDDEKEKEKYYRVANSTADGLLRGLGFGGAAISVGKNMVLEAISQYKSGRPNYEKVAYKALTLSPPIDTKVRKLASAGRAFTYRQTKEKIFTEGLSLENPAFKAIGEIVSATTNVPLDRVVTKLDNLSTPVRQDVETWQAISLALGYSKWDIGLIENSTKKPKSSTRGLKIKKIKLKKIGKR